MRRRAFIRTAAGLFVPAIIGRGQIPLSIGDPAFLARRRSAGVSCTGQGATWAAQVVTNGGAAPSSTTICAFDTFWSAVVTAGIDSKMLSVNCMAPDSLIAARTPLYKTAGNALWTDAVTPFASGDLTVNGLKSDGANKYLKTGIIPSSHIPSATSAGLTVYVTENPGSAPRGEIGCYDGNTFLLDVDYSGLVLWDCWNFSTGAGRVEVSGYANWTGFMSGNRTASNATAVYKAKSSVPFATVGSHTGSGGSRPSSEIFAFCIHLGGGTVSDITTRRLSFVAIHTGLTSGEAQSLYNAIQAMRTTLGGGYI